MVQTIGLNLQKGARARGRYLKEHHILGGVGDNVNFQPRMIPLYPELIRLHSNITIGAGVRFVTHDAVHAVLNRMEIGRFPEVVGCIEIMDNVFVGADSTIMSNVRIGKNVIIGANTLVNKDCEPNSVYAGIPARKVATFEEFVERRSKSDCPTVARNQNITPEEIRVAWEYFEAGR